MYRGKYERDQYLLTIIRDYEEVARDYVKQHVSFTLNNVKTTFNKTQKMLEQKEIFREEELRN